MKYATKAADFSKDSERVVEFFRAFENIRRVQMFGSFLGKQTEPQEPLEEEEQNPEDFVGCACGQCRWKDGVQGGLFRERDTFLDPNGLRQLKLFKDDLWWRPEKPAEPEPQLPSPNNLDLFFEQRELSFQI